MRESHVPDFSWQPRQGRGVQRGLTAVGATPRVHLWMQRFRAQHAGRYQGEPVSKGRRRCSRAGQAWMPSRLLLYWGYIALE